MNRKLIWKIQTEHYTDNNEQEKNMIAVAHIMVCSDYLCHVARDSVIRAAVTWPGSRDRSPGRMSTSRHADHKYSSELWLDVSLWNSRQLRELAAGKCSQQE